MCGIRKCSICRVNVEHWRKDILPVAHFTRKQFVYLKTSHYEELGKKRVD
jgi:hypothetical protein